MEVIPVPVLADNYSYLVFDPSTRAAAVVDCAEVDPVVRAAEMAGVVISAILSTHHHFDHVGGNEQLAKRFPVRVYGNAEDADRIPALTDGVQDGQTLKILGMPAEILFIPAHTSGHIAFHFPQEKLVFTGDTLFAAGCGRLFEGKPSQMMASLSRLAGLPKETKVYCGHEYTVRNLEFALSLEPENQAVLDKLAWARAQRSAGLATVPTTLASEYETNPFLRYRSPELRASIQKHFPAVRDDDTEIFAKTRELKDHF